MTLVPPTSLSATMKIVGKSFSVDTDGCFPRGEVVRVWTWPL